MASWPLKQECAARTRLFGGNRMKLGVMAFNCSHGSTITTVPEAWKLDWNDTVEVAQAVDRRDWELVRSTHHPNADDDHAK
jgi:hypothetical protein